MKHFFSRAICIPLLLLAGCSDEEPANTGMFAQLNQNTDFSLDGTSFDATRYEVFLLPSDGSVVNLAARAMSIPCVDDHQVPDKFEKAIRADLHIADLAKLPLGTPINVADPMASIHAELSALDAKEACLFWEGSAEGTVTIDSVELNGDPTKNVIRGTFDLHADEAMPKCSGGKPKLLQMRWTGFAPVNASYCPGS